MTTYEYVNRCTNAVLVVLNANGVTCLLSLPKKQFYSHRRGKINIGWKYIRAWEGEEGTRELSRLLRLSKTWNSDRESDIYQACWKDYVLESLHFDNFFPNERANLCCKLYNTMLLSLMTLRLDHGKLSMSKGASAWFGCV